MLGLIDVEISNSISYLTLSIKHFGQIGSRQICLESLPMVFSMSMWQETRERGWFGNLYGILPWCGLWPCVASSRGCGSSHQSCHAIFGDWIGWAYRVPPLHSIFRKSDAFQAVLAQICFLSYGGDGRDSDLNMLVIWVAQMKTRCIQNIGVHIVVFFIWWWAECERCITSILLLLLLANFL